MQFLKMNFAVEAIRMLMAMICQFLYPLISNLYNLFINISKVDILSTDQIKPIYQRVTMILTIIMIFYITFECVKYIVQPEGLTDKEKGVGNIVYKMIIVVVLIAFVPGIFEGAYKLQNTIIEKNVIGKVILGKNTNADPSNFGSTFSSNLLSIGYTIDEENIDAGCGDLKCSVIVNMNLNTLLSINKLPYLTMGLDEVVKEETPTVDNTKVEVPAINFQFHGFMSVLVGGFVAYILILYCIDVGVRWAQLVFLQIIAPIPIIGYLSPKKDGIFQKWCKQCLTTYLDLFLRTAVIYFILLICSLLLSSYQDNSMLSNVDQTLRTWAFLFLVLGVMLFAQKAPKMLSELFPKLGAASGDLGLSLKSRSLDKLTKATGRIAGGAAGMATGAVVGAASGLAQGFRRSNSLNKKGNKKGIRAGIFGAAQGLVGGTLGGATRGLVNGAKKGNVLKNATAGVKNQIKANQNFGNRQENGYGFMDQVGDRVRSSVGARSRIEMQEASKAPISRHDEALKKVADARSKIEDRALSKLKENGGKGGVAAQKYDKEQQRLKDLQDNNEVRSREFKVGRYSDDKKAQAEYDKAVANAKAAVNKSNFITQIPEKLDEAGYNAALKAAESTVDKSKFKDPKTGQFDQAGYDTAVTLAKASVNKSNFITPSTQQFDRDGYEKALASAAATVKASDYSVAYKTEAEAQQAYKDAVKAKTDAIDRNMYATDDDYDAALKAAAATVNADIYIKGYLTQEEADKALADEINRQKGIVNEAKDRAVEEYVAKSGDGVIDSVLSTLATEISEYNKTASAEVITEKNPNGTKTYTRRIDEIKPDDIKSDFKTFSDNVKSGEIKQAQDRNANKLIEINSEIERIKRQQSGSGINDGKK